MTGLATPALGAVDVMRLPVMPIVLRHALERAGEGRPTETLARAIGRDAGLAMRFLAATASAAGIQQSANTSLEQQVHTLGGGIAQTILMRAARDRLREPASAAAAQDALAHWAHSLHCAHIAQAVAEACAYSSPHEAYLAGLLHDVGMLALAADMPHAWSGIAAAAAHEGQLLELELDRLETSHAEVSCMLATRIGLPGHLADALLLQHAPYAELLGTHKLVRMLWVTEACTERSGSAPDLQTYARLIGLPPEALDAALRQAAVRFIQDVQELSAPVPAADRWWRLPVPAHEDPARTPEAAWQAGADTRLLDTVMQSASLQQAPALLMGAEDTGGVLSRLRSITAALLGLQMFVAFLHDSAARSLTGWFVSPQRLAPAELDIPMNAGTSLVVRTAIERTPQQAPSTHGGERLRGVDIEIARLLQAPALATVPLTAGSALLGVLAFGVSQEQAQRMALDTGMLQRLAEMASHALTHRKAHADQQRLKETDLRERLRNSARRLVHEARNPLTVMKTHLELLGERVRNGDPIDKDIRVLRAEIDRVSEIIGRIGSADLSVEKAQAPTDINALVRELMVVYREALFVTRAIEVGLELDPRLPSVMTDPNALKQVLLNFWKNASEAMPAGGQVRVRTLDRVNYEGRLMVEISVSDTGTGMPAEMLETLFSERLTMSKGADRGYGLNNAYTLVKQLGGHVLCRSEPERGTMFTVLLPRQSGASAARA
ncbi:MAG: HDOD domain-containing protein [Burkholderiales bacterium]|nr:HDOD domain-containing protein [Burkholderiales bacterium]